jgi:hypothetical protein
MQVKVTVTTEVTDSRGDTLASVTTTRVETIGDNPRFLRSEIVNRDVFDRAVARNLDGVEGTFLADIERHGGRP